MDHFGKGKARKLTKLDWFHGDKFAPSFFRHRCQAQQSPQSDSTFGLAVPGEANPGGFWYHIEAFVKSKKRMSRHVQTVYSIFKYDIDSIQIK